MWNPKWRREGSDPDYRFSLANERTFLAWIRTALALLAGGVIFEQLATRFGPHGLVVAIAIALAVLSAVLCGLAYVRWRDNEIAMRHSHALSAPVAIPVVSVAILLVSAVIVAKWVIR